MVRPDDGEELALMAREMGPQVVGGPARYPSQSGDIRVGGEYIGEYLCEMKGQEVMLVVAPLGPVEELPIICGCVVPHTLTTNAQHVGNNWKMRRGRLRTDCEGKEMTRRV